MSAQPNAIRHGATPEEWDRFAALKGAPLLPVVSNPDAPTSPKSKIPPGNRGKVPSQYNAHREVIGIADWTGKGLIPAAIETCKAEPDFGFCVVTGRGMVAVDVDVMDADLAQEILLTVEIAVGADLAVRTRSNSPKFLVPLIVPGDIAKQMIETRAGRIEILGRGQQFVAAGTHPSDVRYDWHWPASGVPTLTQEQLAGVITALAERFATVPVAAPAATRMRDKNAPAIETDEDAAVARAIEFLKRYPPAVEREKGDHATYVAACRVKELGVPEYRAAEAMATWNLKCSPPWEDSDLAVKIASAYKGSQNAQGSRSPEAIAKICKFDQVPGAERLTPEPDAAPNPKAGMADVLPNSDVSLVRKEVFGDVMQTPVYRRTLRAADVETAGTVDVPYVVKGWLPRQKSGIMFGRWGGGKTFLALSMAAHVAAGQEWFGRRVRQAGALIFSWEGDIGMARRLRALKLQYPTWAWEKMPLQIELMRGPLIGPNGGNGSGSAQFHEALHGFRREFGAYPGLVFIDTLRRAIGGSDSDPKLTEPFMALAEQVAKESNACVITLHHPGHSNTDRAKGDSGIESNADVVLRVDGDPKARTGTLVNRKQRDDARGELYYRLDIVHLGFDADGDQVSTCVAVQAAENPLDPKLNATQRKVLEIVRTMAGDAGTVARGSVLDECRKAGIVADGDKGRNKLHKTLEQLATKRLISTDADSVRVLERGAEGVFDDEESGDD